MTQNKIVLLTGYNRFFGQTRKPWVSMDTNAIIKKLTKNGFTVEEYGFHEIINKNIPITDSVIFYTFSQRENLRKYMIDAIRYLDNGSNLIVPSQELLNCHENKGYQELLKKRLNIEGLDGYYFSSKRELAHYKLQFPVVLKLVEGSNAKGVFLVHSREALLKTIEKIEGRTGILTTLDFFRRKYLRKKSFPDFPDYDDRRDYYQYRDYIVPEQRFVLQEYAPELSHDFRVTVFYDHYYVLKRQVRKNDFRASGSKMFDLSSDVDEKLLDYAHGIFHKMNNPHLSLDIGQIGERFVLFEFQAMHFGVRALLKNRGHYGNIDGKWQFSPSQLSIEEEIALGLVKFLKNDQK